MKISPSLVFAAFLSISSLPLAAHDFWIEPSTYRPAAGEIVKLRLRVGQAFQGDPIGRDPGMIIRFDAFSGKTSHAVVGAPRADPAGLLRFENPAGVLVAYQSKPSVATMTRAKFDQYVKEEGLEPFVRSFRWPAGVVSQRDAFSRNAKAFLSAPGLAASGYDRVVGLPLELVPSDDPTRAAAGRKLRFRLLSGGSPAKNVLVVAVSRTRPREIQALRSDAKGQVAFVIDRSDDWLVKAVELKPSGDRSRSEWESVWASYTFHAD